MKDRSFELLNGKRQRLSEHTKTIVDSALSSRMIKSFQWISFIGKGNSLDAVEGHKVVVEITEWPSELKSATGMVVQILGHKNDPGVDILSIIHKHGIVVEFPQEVMDQANKTPDEVQEKDLFKRRDLREDLVITIDGADAKDLDDAISLEKMPTEHIHYRSISPT